jgi:hypothetical protein
MQTFRINLLINFDSLVDNKLTFEGWFVLYCLSTNNNHLLLTYVNKVGVLDINNLLWMEKEDYIILTKNKENIVLSSVKITDKGKNLIDKATLNTEKVFEDCFQQLRDTYPNKVPAENGAFRRLHGDLARCKRLYLKILNKDGIDIDLHKSILKAINKEIQERTRGNNLPFMQNLVTYLHQQNFLQYIDVKEEEIDKNRGDDI